jgi:hypothetical protein
MHRAQDDEKRRVKLKYAELARLKEVVRRLTEASTTSDSERQRLLDITTELSDCKTHLADILDELPRDSNGLYLSVILGTTVDVSLMSKNDKSVGLSVRAHMRAGFATKTNTRSSSSP